MKLRIFLSALILLLFFFKPYQSQEQLSINLIHPGENELFEMHGKPFYLIGKVSPAGSTLTVNGTNAEVDEDGRFICYTNVLLEPPAKGNIYKGKFIFKIQNKDNNKEVTKFIRVKLPPSTTPWNILQTDTSWTIEPHLNMMLQTGETVETEIKATPGCKGYFTVEGIKKNFPLVETSFINSFLLPDAVFGDGFKSQGDTIKGIYKGHFIINQALKDSKITFFLVHPKLGRLSKAASGTVTTIDPDIHRVVKINYDPNLTTGRFEAGEGYKLFLNEGTKIEITGKKGEWLRGKLSANESIYFPEDAATYLPEGTPPPHSSIRLIRTKDEGGNVVVEFGLSERLPVSINESATDKIELLIYNVTSNIDWIFYDRKSNFIKEIKYSQPFDGVLKVVIVLNQRTHWGYKQYYDGNILKLHINKPAHRNNAVLFWENQIEGRNIVLDPGHTADYGSTGPGGTKEKDINFQIALKLKDMLESAGATVNLTHDKDIDLPLRERKAKVNSFNPQLCISIHNNAIPQGANPLIHNGSSVYYYYPQALPLAKLIHNNLLNDLKLNDFGLYWDNLYMCRIPESISILVEPAFMIIPMQEKLLNTEDFQSDIAGAIFDGIEEFYKEYSE